MGVATGNECFYSSATPSCSPVIGNVTGKFPEAFLSLHGNWQTTVKSVVVSEDTKVSVHYDFGKLSGEGIAKTLETKGNNPPVEVNSSEGSVSRIDCPKLIVNPINSLPPIPAGPVKVDGVALTTLTISSIYCSSYQSTDQFHCSDYTGYGQTTCNGMQQPNGASISTQTTSGKLCSWNASTSSCATSATICN